jgi:DNA replication protein DnaC
MAENRPSFAQEPRSLTHSDLPSFARRYRLTSHSDARAQKVVEWIETPMSPFLYLWGPTGAQKTTLAVAALIEIRERIVQKNPGVYHSPGNMGIFVPPYRAVQAIRAFDSDSDQMLIREWKRAPLLLIDDIGKHRDTPHVIEQLMFILHDRYDNHDPANGKRRRTIITANMSPKEFGERIDRATQRRIEEGMVLELAIPKGDHQ